ncbi:ABC transporter permease [uncultured Ruminococcus sp.]|uniref:ABC transporter permease n=1 Tax=uncultured Ruminococcus sp. TaxID=165186 RepID=UPI0025FDEA9A|nr:ABC transporter permease [uncultured Ruminococcus sp.]
MRKTRVKYSTILLLFVFCLLPVLTVLTIHHISLTDCLIKMGTGCFGDSYATLTAHDLKSYNDILDPLQTFQSKWAVYEDKTDSNGTIRKIFFNKEYVNLPMESGRFFKASDFEIGNKVAVIGKNKKNEVHEKDGVQYITVEESEYVVIGVIGFENETIIDNYVYINMMTGIIKPDCIFKLDFLNSNQANDVAEALIDDLKNRNINAEILSVENTFASVVMPKVISARWFICLLTVCFLCIWITSIQWVNQQKRDICIRRLVGAKSLDIAVMLSVKYLLIAVLSFVIGYVYCNIICPAYFGSFIRGYLICGVFIVIFLAKSIYSVLHEPIEEAIK